MLDAEAVIGQAADAGIAADLRLCRLAQVGNPDLAGIVEGEGERLVGRVDEARHLRCPAIGGGRDVGDEGEIVGGEDLDAARLVVGNGDQRTILGDRPAVGRHEVLVVDSRTWQEVARIPTVGQPVFTVARPDGRQIWVNPAHPDNATVQVIDVASLSVANSFSPGKAVMHLEFTPKGDAVWISARDDDAVRIYDPRSLALLKELPAEKPSGIFFTARAHRIGY